MSFIPALRTCISTFDRSHVAILEPLQAMVSFTFDDFPSSAYRIGGKMLQEAGAYGTYFVSGSLIGKPGYCTQDDIKTAHAAGHEIGCHGFAHTRLSGVSADRVRVSLAQNQTALRGMLGADFSMTSFAYPYGSVSRISKQIAAQHFAFCRGTRLGANHGRTDLAHLRVISLEQYRWNPAALAGILDTAKRNRSWLIFLSHTVDEAPGRFGTTPAILRETLAAVRQAQMPILTLSAAGKLARAAA